VRRERSGGISLSVKDNGPGVSEEDVGECWAVSTAQKATGSPEVDGGSLLSSALPARTMPAFRSVKGSREKASA
jgi:hypothetical protein